MTIESAGLQKRDKSFLIITRRLILIGVIWLFGEAGFLHAAPLADAGDDRVADPGSEVALDGTRSIDPAGYSLHYQWRQTQGPQVNLVNPTSARPFFSAPGVTRETDLWFTLTVTDYRGETSSDDIRIIVRFVEAGNRSPVLEMDPNPISVEEGTLVTMGSRGSDPDGDAIRFEVCQCDPHGPRVVLSSLTEPRVTFTAPRVQADVALRFNFFLRDPRGGLDLKQFVVTIRNVAARANAGPDRTVNEGEIVQLDGTGSESDGETISYRWTQIAGPRVNLSGSTNPRPRFVAPNVSEKTEVIFQLTVRNQAGVESSDAVTIEVLDIGQSAPGGGNSEIREFIAMPNPSSSQEGTRFQYVLDAPSEVTISILTQFLEPVREINIPMGSPGGAAGLNVVEWDRKNDQGDDVVTGGYFAYITAKDGSGKKTQAFEKVGLIR